MEQLTLEAEKLEAQVMELPSGDGMSFLLAQQQIIGESRRARRLVDSIDQRIADLREKLKDENE